MVESHAAPCDHLLAFGQRGARDGFVGGDQREPAECRGAGESESGLARGRHGLLGGAASGRKFSAPPQEACLQLSA